MAQKQVSTAGVDLQRGLEWERAANMLDLSQEVVRSIRFPRFECVSHHPNLGGVSGSLYIASELLRCEGTIASLRVGADVTSGDRAAQWQELSLAAAVGGCSCSCAAIGLYLNQFAASEQELWQLTQECVPVIARTLGEVTLLPDDEASAAVAAWIAHSAAQFGFRIHVAEAVSGEYCSELIRKRVRIAMNFGSLALNECGKAFERCTVAVVGTGALGCACLESLRQSGARVIAVADESGSLLDRGGIDLGPLLRHVRSGGLFAEYREGQHALHTGAISAGADLILLCGSATETADSDLDHVSDGSVVVEAGNANGFAGAAQQLAEREVLLVPRRLVRGVQLGTECLGHQETRDDDLRRHIAEMWAHIMKVQKQYQRSICEAVMLLAVGRLAEWERSARP